MLPSILNRIGVFLSLKDNILPFEFHRSQSHFLHFGYFSEFEKDSYRTEFSFTGVFSFFCWIPYQVLKQSWTSYPNTFFSGMPLLTYQQVEVRRKHVH
jgi:hypothetical protein